LNLKQGALLLLEELAAICSAGKHAVSKTVSKSKTEESVQRQFLIRKLSNSSSLIAEIFIHFAVDWHEPRQASNVGLTVQQFPTLTSSWEMLLRKEYLVGNNTLRIKTNRESRFVCFCLFAFFFLISSDHHQALDLILSSSSHDLGDQHSWHSAFEVLQILKGD